MNIKKIISNTPYISSAILSVLIAFCSFILLTRLTFELILYYYPSRTILPNGRIERTEALGQLFISVIIGLLVAMIIFVLIFLKLKKRFTKMNVDEK